MKRLTILTIGCSLAAAGALFAQQPDEQQSPTKGPKHGGNKSQTTSESQHEQGATTTGKGRRNREQQAGGAQQEQGQTPSTTQENRGRKAGHGAHAKENAGAESNATPKTEGANATSPSGANAEESASPTREGRGGKNARNRQGGKNARNASANASPSAAPSASASAPTGATAGASASPSSTTTGRTSQEQNAAAGANANVAAGANAGGHNRRVEPQKVQQVKQNVAQIKQQHASFHAQPRPDKAPPVTFNANFHIQGSDHWQGPQYQVFRSYRPQWHDRNWYHQHYHRVELIGGGYYYWNNGYWYPAWGYDSGNQYYAYDGPIYVGHSAEPPDKVIADVQAELQEMGYYTGEVDGLLGPLTREALTAYQEDQGLQATAAIDEPTLDSLGMQS